MFNMAHMGLRLGQRANGVSKLHGARQPRHVRGLWPGFDDDEVPIGSVTNGVHAPTWAARELVELGDQLGVQSPWLGRSLDEVTGRSRSGRCAARCAAGWSTRCAAASAASWLHARRHRGRARLDRRRLRPRRPHHRLRPAGPVLQAADADAARPGAAQGAAARPGAADPDRHRRQVATRPTTAASSSSSRWCASPTTPRSGTGSCSCPTTTSAWPATSTGAATSG